MRRGAKFVVLGSTVTSYVIIILTIGGLIWRDVPQDLESFLLRSQRGELPEVEFVALGWEGQYFVHFSDGDGHVGGCSPTDETFLRTKVPGELCEVYFGSDGVLVRYNPSDSKSEEGGKDQVDEAADAEQDEFGQKRKNDQDELSHLTKSQRQRNKSEK